jgi:hypothetical protein
LISSSKKYVLLFLRENQSGEESLKVKTSLEGCTKEKKHELEEFLKAYRECSRSLKGYHLRGKWSMKSNYFQTPPC